jgi:hypothetical protein
MATIITISALKKILKKFQSDVIFKKYDDKIAQIEQKNLNQDNSISALETNLQNEIARATNKENELSDKCDSYSTETASAISTLESNLQSEISALESEIQNEIQSEIQNEIARATNKENELSNTKVDILSLSADKSISANSYNAVLIIATEALTLTYPNTSGTEITQALTAGSMTILAKSGSGYTNSIFGAVYN